MNIKVGWAPLPTVRGTANRLVGIGAHPTVICHGCKEKLNAQGLTPRGTTLEELGTGTKAQLVKYGKPIRKSGITAE